MLGEFERQNERDSTNYQTRIWIEADRAPIDHNGTDIATLFRYWQERSFLENGTPALADFRPPLSNLPWVDVTSIDPLWYTMRNHPAGVCGNWEATPFAGHPVPMHAKALAREYMFCKRLRAPAYIHIQQTMLGVEREYAKLLLPVADETGAITRIVYAWRFVRDPIILSRMN